LIPGIGLPEIIIVLVIVLVIFGPKRLPDLGRSLGGGMREFKESVTGNKKDDDELEAGETAEPVRAEKAEPVRAEKAEPVRESVRTEKSEPTPAGGKSSWGSSEASRRSQAPCRAYDRSITRSG